MIITDKTKLTAEELLVDVAACRQFRHLTKRKVRKVVDDTFLARAECYFGPQAVKHPDPNNPCTECGKPRSKFAYGQRGLCHRCYAKSPQTDPTIWVEDVYEMAVDAYGFSCDSCDGVSAPAEGKTRATARDILENYESIRPILCADCLRDFRSFCTRNYGGGWRLSDARQIERMTLAWIAQKVKVLAENLVLLRVAREANKARAAAE